MAELDKLVVRIEADLAPLTRELRRGERITAGSTTKMQGSFKEFDRGIDTTVIRLASFGSALKMVAGTGGLGSLGKDVLQTGIEFEKLEQTLNAAFGSAKDGARELAFLRTEAHRLGVDVRASGLEFARFALVAKGTKVEGEGVREVFTGISEAATVLRLSGDQVGRIFKDLRQILDNGTVSMGDIQQKLSENIPGALKISADALGITTAEFIKFVEKGVIPSEKFVLRFARELSRRFGKDVAIAVQSATAKIQRFRNALFFLQAEVARGFLGGVADPLDEIAETLSDPQILRGARELGKELGNLINLLVENRTTVLAVLAGIVALRVAPGKGIPKLAAALAAAGGVGILLEGMGADARKAAAEIAELDLKIEKLRGTIERRQTVGFDPGVAGDAQRRLLSRLDKEVRELELRRDVLREEQLAGDTAGTTRPLPPKQPPFTTGVGGQSKEAIKTTKELASAVKSLNARLRDSRASLEDEIKFLNLDAKILGEDAAARERARKELELSTLRTREQDEILRIHAETLQGLNDKLDQGTIKQKAFDEGVLRANLLLDEATGALARTGDGVDSLGDRYEAAARQLERMSEAQATFDDLMKSARTPVDDFNKRMRQLTVLQQQGRISTDQFAKAQKEAQRILREADEGAKDFTIAVENMATAISTELEDAIVNAGGSVNGFRHIVRALEKDIIRVITRLTVTKPLERALTGAFASGGQFDFGSFFGQATTRAAPSLIGDFSAGFAHKGGVVGAPGIPHKAVSPLAFVGAPRMHRGGIVGFQPDLSKLGLRPNERPIVAEVGETVVPKGRRVGGTVININLPPGADARGFRESAAFVARRTADEIDRRAKFR